MKYFIDRYVILIEKLGENPTRSRRCERERLHMMSLAQAGKAWRSDELKSEDLPIDDTTAARDSKGMGISISLAFYYAM